MKKANLVRLLMAFVLLSAVGICASAQRVPGTKETKEKPPTTEQPAPPADPAVAPCPTITMQAPQGPIRDGKPVGFAVNVAGGDPKVVPMFNWSISAGTVTGGQGTRLIGVDSTGAGMNKAITATVQIGGFAPECTADAAATISVAGPAQKLDEYGALTEADETARLDMFIANVTDKEQAFIITYAGRTSPRGQAYTDNKRIRAYLLKAGTPSERIATIDGGYRDEISHELWLVPIGAETPRPTPTVNAKDIVFPKPTPPVKKP